MFGNSISWWKDIGVDIDIKGTDPSDGDNEKGMAHE